MAKLRSTSRSSLLAPWTFGLTATLLALCPAVASAEELIGRGGYDPERTKDDEGDTIGADSSQRDLRRKPRPDPTEFRSEQYGAFELRFGPYVPDVDSEFDGAATPYEDLFGDSQRYHIGLEVDWQVLRIPYFGSLGPGVSVAYTRSTGRAPFTAGGGYSDDRTSLWIVPMAALAVLRVDVLAQRFGVPFVPYAKAGFSYALWSSSAGEGADRYEGEVGRGAETGYQAAVGLMFWLNILHPQSALDMDNATGINNSYVFGELFTSDVDSFGTGMQVGTDTWVVGLAFEF